MGGSQGAHGINEAAIKAMPLLKELPLQVIHLTGANDEQVAAANYRRDEFPAHVSAFCHQMELAYSAADLALSRSGAASLSKLSHFGIPSLLIPFPFAAENHQALNAAIFEREGAAVVVEQGQVSVEAFAREIGALLRDEARLEKMSQSSRNLAPANAAECVADTIERAAVQRKSVTSSNSGEGRKK
jgi:UDP-N-acetylglucosamine--N-acetylmuramyl-(pentapeptide) pyrophosphoryl-undecaprenol N-acetylglucosamine transferase